MEDEHVALVKPEGELFEFVYTMSERHKLSRWETAYVLAQVFADWLTWNLRTEQAKVVPDTISNWELVYDLSRLLSGWLVRAIGADRRAADRDNQ